MKILGKHTFSHGRLVPDPGMRRINSMVAGMHLLAGPSVMPYFYVDAEGRYWRYEQSEDYTTELEEVGREYLGDHAPGVDPNRWRDAHPDP